MLHVDIMFVQGLPFFICIATPLRLYTFIFLSDGRGEPSVRLAIGALLKLSVNEILFLSVYCQMVKDLLRYVLT